MNLLSIAAFTLLTWPSLVAAGPLKTLGEPLRLGYCSTANQITDIDVPQGDFDTLNLYAQYSTAAYCSANFAATPGTNVTCPGGSCPMILSGNTEIIDSFTL